MSVTIVLYQTEHPGNLGSVARVASNFGFSDIVLVEPKCAITEESKNLAKHGQNVLKKMKTSSISVLGEFDIVVMTHGREADSYNIVRSSITPRELLERLRELKDTKIGILFGPEGEGLPPEMLRRADIILSIPTMQENPSMNLAMSVGIVLYELSLLSEKDKITEPFEPMGQRERKVLLDLVDECLDNWEFPHAKRKDTLRIAWRRMIGRSFLTKREAFAIMGFLKRVLGRR